MHVGVPLNEYANCIDGELRLAGGTELSGRVEICYNRVWYGICSDNYNRYNIPTTICKGLGHSPQGMNCPFFLLVGMCHRIDINVINITLIETS